MIGPGCRNLILWTDIAVRQRTYDTDTDTYETTQGNAFTIERQMPVPFEMTINLDIWTAIPIKKCNC
jgi:hypothetical protein